MKNLTEIFKDKNTEIFWHGCMLIVVGIGAYVRTKGLGNWSLAIDEYHIAKSVNYILEHGLPQFPCGGYYSRGILYQYLAAPLLLIGTGWDEFFLRIIPVCFNLAAIPAIYLLSREVGGNKTGCAAVIVYSLSLWEIEFARFARMYAPFQMIFMYYLLSLYHLIVNKNERYRKWIYILSITSIFIHASAVFLITMNFLPFIIDRQRLNWRHIAISSLIFLVAYKYLTFDFRHLGVTQSLPHDIMVKSSSGGAVIRPYFLLQTVWSNTTWLYLTILPFLSTSYLTLTALKSKEICWEYKFVISFFIITSLFNQFGLLLLFAPTFLLIHWIKKNYLRYPITLFASFQIIFNFFFWLTYTFLTRDWCQYFNDNWSHSFKKILVVFFKFPNIYDAIIYPWSQAVPLLGLMAVFFVFGGISLRLYENDERMLGYDLLAALLLILIILVGIFRIQYQTTRYSFFLYPLILLVAIQSIANCCLTVKKINKIFPKLIVLFATLLFIISEDFSFNHIMHIDSQEVNYRMKYNEQRADHFFRRKDYRTPSEAINLNFGENDIVVSTRLAPDYYLNRLDYVYLEPRSGEFKALAACEGKRERWSDARLIYRSDELFQLLDKNLSTVWLITFSENVRYRKEVEKIIPQKYWQYRWFRSLDGRIDVYKINPSDI